MSSTSSNPHRPEPASRAILGGLSRYLYLTAQHLVDLGVVRSLRSAQDHFNRLTGTAGTKLVAEYRPGAARNLGRIPYAFYLTPAGGEAAQQVVGFLPPVVKSPPDWLYDYWHRMAFLDAQISLERWAERAGGRVVTAKAYFHPGGTRGVPVTTVPLDRGKPRLVIDGVFNLRGQDGNERLCALEIWMGLNTSEVLDRAARYCYALHASRKAIGAAFGYPSAVRVLFVFESEAGQRAVLARCGEVVGWDGYAPQFFFKTMASFKADPFDGWTEPVTGKQKPLYRIA